VAGVEEPVSAPAAIAAALLLLVPAAAPAQERPAEADLFGTPVEPPREPPGTAPPAPAPPAAGQAAGGDRRGDAILGEAGGSRTTGLIGGEREDWLKLGGLAYLRAGTTWNRDTAPARWTFTDPSLLDLYLDARPNDRVRAYALGRLVYLPSGSSGGLAALGVPGTGSGATAGATSRGSLDQLWINFDVGRTVFVTAGKQHVKWGTGRFWNPTDYLHPTRRDPLTQFDDRGGVMMVKAHLPWEKRGWNLYGVALLEDVAGGLQPDGSMRTVSTLGQVGGGARAEVVLGGLELAVDGVAQRGHAPRFGVDGSFPLGDLDLRFEVALRRGPDQPRWEKVPGAAPDAELLSRYQVQQFDRITPAAVVGAEWSWQYSDQDSLTLGGEYAYDASGYRSADIYPFLLAAPVVSQYLPGLVAADQRNGFTPFYLARQYLGLYLYLPRPGSWNDTSFTLSALGSLTDGSGVVRLDHSVLVNTYLKLETFVAGHVGNEGGEFRFGGTIAPQYLGAGVFTPTIRIAPPVLDFGVALRVSL
jgi:hypothetical protein